MFLINSDNVYLWEEYIYGTLAHEYQHMIHWYTDRNESTWMNEGFSMLAELLNGYDIGGHDYSYLVNTDIQLTDWGDEVGSNSPYYGASFLYMAYFLDRFGEDVTKAVVAHPENSMESIDLVMNEMGIRDPLTGRSSPQMRSSPIGRSQTCCWTPPWGTAAMIMAITTRSRLP